MVIREEASFRQAALPKGLDQSGFAYLWLLFLIALMGLGLSAASDVYSTVAKRDREKALMAVGRQFQEAIGRYYAFRPAGAKREFPASLEDLLLDPRSPGTVRHLRKIFVDPMTGKAEWGLVRIGDRIIGVHSLSEEPVIKKDGFEPDLRLLAGKSSYAEWLFIHEITTVDPALPAGQGGQGDQAVGNTDQRKDLND
ncbi:type II secretory pathway pseudopilin PulG [Hydrogenophaga palleronii]|uniref:Type II secretory pathway pseudopilin PulG n=1 Tax=Hydrogenophaga palleronii TaxID=65655 RepID=A0ABU1WTX5_9BURK|nr:type II secretion system protein [Hydrogenophaga palleronii]MDR7152735.1 type II secretory pathway pseudopilin PulG [Hydrogenophaga palleronii]